MKRLLIPITILAALIFGALPALAVPKDKYDPKSPQLSVDNFKATLAKEKHAWVMFTDSDPKVPEKVRTQGAEFWNAIKARYEKQVKTYIVIDTNGWPDNARAAKKEIMTNTYPAYALYEDGEVLNVGTMYAVIINGAPLKEQYEEIFNFINEMSFLK